MPSPVYFMNDRSVSIETSLVPKMLTVFDAAGLGDLIQPYDLVAIKVHCGEYNNTSYLRPVYARALADKVRSLGGRPFVCDTTTMSYNASPSRTSALDLMLTAERNGLNSGTLGCPFICADGFFGTDDVRVDLPEGILLKEAYIAKAVAMADVVIALTHFKGHRVGTYGGAIKNMGIGCQSKRGKLNVHLAGHPQWGLNASVFNPHLCPGRDCPQWQLCEECCPYGLIRITDHTIEWDAENCRNCLAHLGVVTCGVLSAPADNCDGLGVAIADAALGAVKAVGRDKVGYINMAIDISPWCDCALWSDRSIVPNVGVFAGKDPVAIDQACMDMVSQSAGVLESAAHAAGVTNPGVPKFTASSSLVGASEELQINTGAKNGLGSKEYELIECPPAAVSQFRFHWDPRTNLTRLGRLFCKEPVYPEGGFKRSELANLEALR